MRGGQRKCGNWRGGIDWRPLLASMGLHFLAVLACGRLLTPTPEGEPQVRVAEVTLTFPSARPEWEEPEPVMSAGLSEAPAASAGDALPQAEEAPGIGRGGWELADKPGAPLTAASAGAPLMTPAARGVPSGGGGNTAADEKRMREEIERWEASLPPSGPRTEIGLFGERLSGHSFVFVIDRSASTASKHSAACAEIERQCAAAIEALPEANRFQVILYNDRISPHRGLRLGLAAEKADAKERMLRFPPSGGTMHIDALRAALLLRANVVCWFSDGGDPELSAAQIEDLALLAGRSKSVIHAWRIGKRPATAEGDFMRRLAERTGGDFHEGAPAAR